MPFYKGHTINLGKKRGIMPEWWRLKLSESHKGIKYTDRKKPESFTEEHINNMRLAHPKGEELYNWKGVGASYRSIHNWVVNHKGKPDTCEHCGKSGLTGRFIQWANIDHQYKRNLDDYIRLCTKCHKQYDKNQGVCFE